MENVRFIKPLRYQLDIYVQIKYSLTCAVSIKFNLSYKVTITCKWHQLVYFPSLQPKNRIKPLDFHCISPVRFGNKAQNANFSAKEQHQKLHISIVNV